MNISPLFTPSRILPLLAAAFLTACVSQPPQRPVESAILNVPVTVELPAGSFYMGDQNGSGDADERPLSQQHVKAFAMSHYEITFNNLMNLPMPRGVHGLMIMAGGVISCRLLISAGMMLWLIPSG